MIKLKIRFISLILIILSGSSLKAGEEFCGIKNSSFKNGEEIKMKVYYNTLGIYIAAGEAYFSTSVEKYNGKTVFHCTGEGKTYSFFDKFFKVRDKYETYIDTTTLLPIKFIRNVEEGKTRIYNNVTFNHSAQTAVSTNGIYKIPECIQDIISSIYYARNIDFNKQSPGSRIPYDMFLDNEIYHLSLSYVGKEIVRTRFGKFNAIKFVPLLIKGAIFQGGEKMNVWVSDDPNHIVLRLESPISVGSVKIDMMGYKNLRYPLSSQIR